MQHTIDLATALRLERRERDMSQEEVAAKLGVSQQRYANFERGTVPRPSSDDYEELMRAMARFLDVPVLEILRLAYMPNLDAAPSQAAVDDRLARLEADLAALRGTAAGKAKKASTSK